MLDKGSGDLQIVLIDLERQWKLLYHLLDKQVNAQEEKNFRGSRKLPQAHEKVCDENETKKQEKNDTRIKMLFIEGSPL